MNTIAEEVDGRSARWDTHRTQRRLELARHARRAIHRFGPEVSMDDIAKQAGTSKSIVYRYFTDKAGLQAAVAELVATDIERLLVRTITDADSPAHALRSMVKVYLDTIGASPHVYAFITSTGSGLSGSAMTRFLNTVIGLVSEPLTQEMATDGMTTIDVEAWSAGAVGYVQGIGEWWMRHQGEPDVPSVETLTHAVATWLWQGPTAHMLTQSATTQPIFSAMDKGVRT